MKNKAVKTHYDFLVIFATERSNPSDEIIGGERIVREIRRYVERVKNDVPGCEIYNEEAHREKMEKAYRAFVLKSKRNRRQRITPERQLQKWICKRYFDVRAFGASTIVGDNPGGQMRGPVQFGQVKNVGQVDKDQHPYALYKIEGFVSVILAERTGFSGDDLEVVWQALENVFGCDGNIVADGRMVIRKLIVFKHKTSLGDISHSGLFERVKIVCKNVSSVAKECLDCDIIIDRNNLPASLEICERV
jgi:CRISPR-associated protein Csd2